MRRGGDKATDAAALRRRAEKRLQARATAAAPPQPDADPQRLLHELQVHEIELRLQNEELRQTRDELEQRVEERTADLSRTIQALATRSEQLRALGSELTLAEQRERQRLAAVLHDEHQQLLVAAKLRVSLLERMKDPHRIRETCRETTALLEEAIEHARSVIQELNPPILAAGGLIPALEWLARWIEEKHRLTVRLEAEETAMSGPQDLIILLFQAVRELLFNIVKHAKVQTARVQLSNRAGEVCLRVTDRGVGFAPASLRVEGGTAGGSGLFSIRQRLTLLGGRLDIDSAPGQGSRITIWAPFQPAPAAVLPLPVSPDKSGRGGMIADSPRALIPAGKIRVVIVDDHRLVRQGLSRLLSAEPGVEVVGEAATGQEAVDLVRQLRPDVVTMDVSMPGMNGIEATRHIHVECPAVRVIALSMFEEREQAEAMRAAGAVAYVTKRQAANTLIAAIRACAPR